ncbi:MAG: group II intron reverse transcriptase/maturase [Pirellulaceae bacterium]|nr:group II intron reverse transcriptase/maturase [Pirellulaceae bacterium]
MGMSLWGSSPLYEIGISGRSVYQLTASREEVLGEGNCGRATDRGKEACECVGKYRVCRLPSERQSPLGRIHTESAGLRTETSYKAGPVRRVSIDKPDGGKRLLGIPNLIDRLIQQAIVQILTPVFDPNVSTSSYGFRPKRSAHGAAKQVQRTIRRGYRFAVDMDLSKFFDRVGHDVLMARISRKVHDKTLLRLIGGYLRAGVMVDGHFQATTQGTPQGGPAFPLLANILLDELDKELEKRGLPFVRYADDFVIFTKSKRSAERGFQSVHRYLTRQLHLVVNLEKSRIVTTEQLEYLGYSFVGSRATINVSAKSIERFKHRIREITGRSRGISMERRLGELKRFVRGWMGYYGLASQLKLFASLEQWIRRRIRCCYWKRWRHVCTRIRELIALSLPRRQAIRHGRSRKGPWHMAKTIASGVGMTNAWLTDQGVPEPKDFMERTCSSSLNRRMRTRMSGGVGRAVSNDRPYPISALIHRLLI